MMSLNLNVLDIQLTFDINKFLYHFFMSVTMGTECTVFDGLPCVVFVRGLRLVRHFQHFQFFHKLFRTEATNPYSKMLLTL